MLQVYAQESTEYKLLEKIPGFGDSISTSGADTFQYFGVVYSSVLTLVVALAVLMIVIGGVQYTASWSGAGGKEDGKKKIYGAIGGLLLALSSYLILYTINPQLLNTISVPTGTGPNQGGGAFNHSDPLWPGDANGDGVPDSLDDEEGADPKDPGSDGGSAGGMSEKDARDYLKGKIAVNHTCDDRGCQTRLAGIKKETLDEMLRMREECKCNLTITAGTEHGHSTAGSHTHANGYKADLRLTPALNSYVETSGNFTRGADRGDGAETWVKNGTGGKTIYYKEGNHWDVAVK